MQSLIWKISAIGMLIANLVMLVVNTQPISGSLQQKEKEQISPASIHLQPPATASPGN